MRIGFFGSTPLLVAGAGRSSTMARWLGVVAVEAMLAARLWGVSGGVAAAEVDIVTHMANKAEVQSCDVVQLTVKRDSSVVVRAVVAPPSIRMRFRSAGFSLLRRSGQSTRGRQNS